MENKDDLQRLIIEYAIGDGYTYSATMTCPFIYKNKQEAIDDLTLILLDYPEKIKEFKEENSLLFEASQTSLKALNTFINKDKKNNKNLDNLKKDAENKQQLYLEQQKTKPSFFDFGGITLEYDYFLYQDDKSNFNIVLPEIFTLDEYYYEVENKVKQQPVKSPIFKMK